MDSATAKNVWTLRGRYRRDPARVAYSFGLKVLRRLRQTPRLPRPRVRTIPTGLYMQWDRGVVTVYCEADEDSALWVVSGPDGFVDVDYEDHDFDVDYGAGCVESAFRR